LSGDAVGASFGFLSEHLVSRIFEGLGLRDEGERLLDHGIPIRHHAKALLLSELAGDDVLFQIDLDPIEVLIDLLVAHRGDVILSGQPLFEVAQHGVVDLEVPVDSAVGQVVGCEVEERSLVDQVVLEVIVLRGIDLLVGRDATASVYGAA